MVIYELECSAGHRFEGRFPSLVSFQKQEQKGLIFCSVCGGGDVTKIPSGGHAKVSSKKSGIEKKNREEITTNVDPVTLLKMVDHYIKKNFQDVGKDFSKEAISMHEGEKEGKPIFGTATSDEKDLMETKGVAFSSLPKLPESTEN